MNNSINYSHFADLLVFEYSKEKDFTHNEQTSQENSLSLDDPDYEMHYSHTKVEIE